MNTKLVTRLALTVVLAATMLAGGLVAATGAEAQAWGGWTWGDYSAPVVEIDTDTDSDSDNGTSVSFAEASASSDSGESVSVSVSASSCVVNGVESDQADCDAAAADINTRYQRRCYFRC